MAETVVATKITRGDRFYVGDWLVDSATDRLLHGQQEIKLEPRVMDLLLCLASQPGEVITREELESTVWAGMVVGYDSLTSAMIKLRKAFNDDSRNPRIIETVAKRGYRLIAQVAPADTQREAPSSVAEPAPGKPLTARRMGMYLALALLISGFGALLAVRFQQPGPVENAARPGTAKDKDMVSLVVLPFTNGNNDKSQEYFSDGITDDLINDLSQYSGLHVIARRSAYIYKQRHSDIQTIARELGVSYVLDGDVRREGDKIRMNVQLIDARTGVNIWAQRFDRQTKHIFDVQDDIRKHIINALSVKLTQEEERRSQRRYTNSFAAYDLFLRGQAKLVTRASAADSRQAQDLMEQAIKLDPNFARAYAALALILADAYRFDWSKNPEATRQQALKTGKRAIELDKHSPQAYWILGYIYLFLYEDHDQAIAMAKTATELAPDDMDAANVLAVTYAFGDEPAKAKLITQGIMKRYPRYSALVPSVLGLANFRLGHYAESLAAYDKSLLINPSRIQALVYRAVVLYRMGNEDDAAFQIDDLYNMHPDFDVKVWAARQPFKDKSIVKGMVSDLYKIGVHK